MDRLRPDFGQNTENRRDAERRPMLPRMPIEKLIARQAEIPDRSTREDIPPRVGVEALGTVLARRSSGETPRQESKEAVAIPKLVMEQTAAAAEQNIALEKVYELRSEVRDDPTFGAQSDDNRNDNSRRDQQGADLNGSYAGSQADEQHAKRGLRAYYLSLPVRYRQSILLGFIIALILAFLVGIVFLLTSRSSG